MSRTTIGILRLQRVRQVASVGEMEAGMDIRDRMMDTHTQMQA
jgi:hypothetical protein